jgi:hypothetical protein
MYDLAMHRADLAAFCRHGNWRIAQNGFDTKTFAIYRHEFFPPLHCPRVLNHGDLTSGSRRNIARWRFARCRTPPINHEGPAFTQNKRYRTNPGALADVVNRNAASVYQTD